MSKKRETDIYFAIARKKNAADKKRAEMFLFVR